MSHRIEAKQARRAEQLLLEQDARRRQHLLRGGGLLSVFLIAVALVGVAIANSQSSSNLSAASGSSAPAVGAAAPSFSLTNAVTGRTLTSASLRGHKTLLFFSEGVTCQACLVQAADLQKSTLLRAAGIRLVSITTDTASQLAQAAREYGIHAPMLADPTRTMSNAYGMIAVGGMQMPGEDGHAFILLSSTGRVLWRQAYPTMYVKPSQLLADIGQARA